MSIFLGGNASANELNDYEEGSWTATATGGVDSITYITCRYTKIGRMIQLSSRFTLSGSSGGGALSVSGLPFQSGAQNQNSFSIMHNGFDEGGSQEPELHGHIGSSTTTVSFYYTRTNGANWNQVTGTEAVSHEIIWATTYYTDL